MENKWYEILSKENPLGIHIPPFLHGIPHKFGNSGYYKDTERALFVVVQKSGKRFVKEGFVRVYNNHEIRFMIPGTIDKITHWMPLPEPPNNDENK